MFPTRMKEEAVSLTEAEEVRYAELQLMALDFARHGETAQLESMIASGLPVNLSDGRGNSLLMLAAYHGNEATVRMLLEKGADPERCNDRGQTPLAGVAFKGHLGVARALVEGGAGVDSPCDGGQVPLQFAALFGNREMYDYLLSLSREDSGKRIMGISTAILVSVTARLRRLFA